MNLFRKKIEQLIHRKFKQIETDLHELSYLFWECTLRCNLNCLHCGSDCQKSSLHKDMPLEDFKKVILEIEPFIDKRKFILAITGGEPLLRKDLEEAGQFLKEHQIKWGLVSNAMAYTFERHNQLMKAGLRSITFSLDGLKESHNWLRNNSKSYDNVKNAIELISNETHLDYDLVTCVHKKNLSELPELKEELIRRKVRTWRIFTISPIGRAASNDLFKLNQTEYKELLTFIKESRNEGKIEVKYSCEAYVGKFEREVRDSLFFCRAGINIASILIDGSISACPNINRKLIQGNIYKDKFMDVWNQEFKQMRIKSYLKSGLCKSCSKYKDCNGGALHLRDEHLNLIQCHYQEFLK